MTTTYRIDRLGHLGHGIAAGPVYAIGTLPGEEVTGTLIGDRLSDIKVVTPSEDRVRPPCRHAKSCGGCSLQHASDAYVARWKVGVVSEALSAQGLTADVTLISTSAPETRRRATVSARRTKKGALIGFHARASDTVVEIPDCQLLHPDLRNMFGYLEALTVEFGSRKGEIAFAMTQSTNGIDLTVAGAKPLADLEQPAVIAKAEANGVARLTWDDELIATLNPPYQRMGAAMVEPPAGAFQQATEAGQLALVQEVERLLGPKADRVLDLFAGCGTFALPIAARAEVHAVESEADMLAALDSGWRRAKGLKQVTTETRDLFRRPLMPDELDPFDVVVIDPPRAGAEAQVNELAKSNVKRVVSVSCNPVTFARDVRISTDAGYTLGPVAVVDQFRWSTHVEMVAVLTKP